jgi:hypothetical protein
MLRKIFESNGDVNSRCKIVHGEEIKCSYRSRNVHKAAECRRLTVGWIYGENEGK